MDYENIEKVVHLSSDVSRSCTECRHLLTSLENGINHYLEHHDYMLLHTGQETIHEIEASQTTVAVLGKPMAFNQVLADALEDG
ncbi:hypothetical protein ACM26W_01195 [Halomonas sp. HK25]|uniref:hypothetical protein n=1 Tax=Halomonas sp. HK25 TaxID=3394321 RepID=UPI0039FD3581